MRRLLGVTAGFLVGVILGARLGRVRGVTPPDTERAPVLLAPAGGASGDVFELHQPTV